MSKEEHTSISLLTEAIRKQIELRKNDYSHANLIDMYLKFGDKYSAHEMAG